MKKTISTMMVLFFVFQIMYTPSWAHNNYNISADSFFLQIKQLSFDYDNSGGLADANSNSVQTNRLIVKTKTNVSLANTYSASAVVEGYDCMHILQYQTSDQAKYAFTKLSQIEDVEYVEYDFYFNLSSAEDNKIYDSSNAKNLWNTKTANVINAFNYLSELGIKCHETRVAVLDSGIYSSHSHFDNINKNRIIDSGYIYKVEIAGNDENPEDHFEYYSSMEDDCYHGTFVGGVVFNNTANNVKIVPYRISNSLEVLYTDILSAFDVMIHQKFDVINMSLAIPLKTNDGCVTLHNYIEKAINEGTVVIAATGNRYGNVSKYSPACLDEVIAVSASTEDNLPADFSNYGETVDISAPGTNIKSPSPRTEEQLDSDVPWVPGNNYLIRSGTSFAAPLVSAAAATLKSIYPNMSPALVEEIIKESAYVPDNWAESCGEKNYGVGIIDFYNMLMVAKEKMKPQIFFNSANKFEIKSLEPSHTIYYTLDGSEPTPENGVLYTEPLDLSKKVINVIKAASFMGDAQVSETTVYRTTSFKDMKINRGETEKAVSDSYRGKIRWRSDNLAVATVDSEGNVTGVSEGKTNVVATLESGKRIIFNVTVKEQPLYWLIELFDFWLSLFGINI